MHRLLLPLVAAGLVAAAPGARSAEAGQGRAITLIDFHYLDTSGEPRDQTAEHRTRLEVFMSGLARDVSAGERFRLVSPRCTPEPCTLVGSPMPELVAAARNAGADLLLVGGIHKMSTLVQWAKVEVVDLRTGRVVFEKLYTFRGDSDEAWRRAETFIAGQVLALPPS